jgi:D-arginine dehydrogenase
MQYDFIIAGAGIAGASVAYELAKTSSVCLVEAKSRPAITPLDARLRCLHRATAARKFGADAREPPLLRASADGVPGNAAAAPTRLSLHRARATRAHSSPPCCEIRRSGGQLIELDSRTARTVVPSCATITVDAAAFDSDAADIDVATLHQAICAVRATPARRSSPICQIRAERTPRPVVP